MTCIAMGLTGVASMIRVFGEERVQYWREASGLPQPWHTVAYFFGKDASMIPQYLLAPLVYCVIYLNITTPRCAPVGVLFMLRCHSCSVGCCDYLQGLLRIVLLGKKLLFS